MLDTKSHASQTALSMHGTPKYERDFQSFSYVNPKAPVGGQLRVGAVGSFNSLNPFLIKGVPARGLGLVYQSLLSRSRDEPFSLYANIAESFEIPASRKWILFSLDKSARFSDGQPIDASDVLFSFETLKTKGRPNHRQYYANVEKVEIIGESKIKFWFKGENVWEMPLIMGLMPILSKSYFGSQPFDKTSLVPPVGSGPYRVEKIDAGRQIIYRRNPSFWGWHLPQYRGRYNFDRIIFDYFRDSDVALEAFKAGELDIRFESDPGKWRNAYGGKEGNPGAYVKEERPLQIPAPMKGLIFNTRHSLFNDIEVRKALTFAFDFEWVNKNILHGAYVRTTSFFQNSPLAATGLPTEDEKTLLSPYASELPPELFNTPFSLPRSDGTGRDRKKLKTARGLLKKAGWILSNGNLIHSKTRKIFQFEILIHDNRDIKLLSAFAQNLNRLGIKVTLRPQDTASYQNRLTTYDFDMIIGQWGQSLSPGNEQSFYWSINAASTPGSRNYPGIALNSVDHLITLIRTARTRKELTTAVRALDRILLFKHYVIPLYHSKQQWLVHWPYIRLPKKSSHYGTSLDVWWYRPIDAEYKKTP
ncbi:MAG: ABC transporter substrate-binding protein [Sneathiella sp.]|nr:ABC transporter substrate-binding protein [Sneathiella sp.]